MSLPGERNSTWLAYRWNTPHVHWDYGLVGSQGLDNLRQIERRSFPGHAVTGRAQTCVLRLSRIGVDSFGTTLPVMELSPTDTSLGWPLSRLLNGHARVIQTGRRSAGRRGCRNTFAVPVPQKSVRLTTHVQPVAAKSLPGSRNGPARPAWTKPSVVHSTKCVWIRE